MWLCSSRQRKDCHHIYVSLVIYPPWHNTTWQRKWDGWLFVRVVFKIISVMIQTSVTANGESGQSGKKLVFPQVMSGKRILGMSCVECPSMKEEEKNFYVFQSLPLKMLIKIIQKIISWIQQLATNFQDKFVKKIIPGEQNRFSLWRFTWNYICWTECFKTLLQCSACLPEKNNSRNYQFLMCPFSVVHCVKGELNFSHHWQSPQFHSVLLITLDLAQVVSWNDILKILATYYCFWIFHVNILIPSLIPLLWFRETKTG